jgi:gliding motility-associated-like protein
MVTSSGTYTLQVLESASGCRDTAQVEIQESDLAGIDLKTLQFPNVLSANGDGKNDYWRPFLPAKPDFDVTEIFENYTLSVFNRWGQLVFDSEKENSKYWTTTPETIAGMYFFTVAYKSTCGTVVDDNHQGSILVVN